MELPEINDLLEQASEQLEVLNISMSSSCPQWSRMHLCVFQQIKGLFVQVGELLHGDSFSMFEAMSAVEVGDPKLDAGVPAQSDPG